MDRAFKELIIWSACVLAMIFTLLFLFDRNRKSEIDELKITLQHYKDVIIEQKMLIGRKDSIIREQDETIWNCIQAMHNEAMNNLRRTQDNLKKIK